MTTQQTHLARVQQRLSVAVLEFCRRHLHQSFYGSDLATFVQAVVPLTAPGSADRVLRALRQRGAVAYTVLSRAGSVYRIDAVVRGV